MQSDEDRQGAAQIAVMTDRRFLADICKALGHPVRLRMIAFIRDAGQCLCGDIVDALPLAQSTVSQHLKVLRQAGLVRAVSDGVRMRYSVDADAIERFKRKILSL
ncbi:DNA-binding transcriptional ArsR family regulator [Desulfobaculum xiamenense]|uniref:DNA-binding transcriptional ArsR family regulator n=1 Tax=Desulfobaculum xiamenense TaxID=995050 RepID=A0A846QRV1_9BACT|nr:metalloregulator ArsR/SmtB family transcription factor [Desulfobaculum xiamenense]NJB67914.1 DNA-binding transcriptional ArsR family regulator [Desulfobaculum xiamenense]